MENIVIGVAHNQPDPLSRDSRDVLDNEQKNIIIRPLITQDREQIAGILERHDMFYPKEIDVALELVDDALKNPEKSDYYFYCAEGRNEKLTGYICFGPVPLTEHTYDLYWLAVDRDTARAGMATRLLHAMEEYVAEKKEKYILTHLHHILMKRRVDFITKTDITQNVYLNIFTVQEIIKLCF